MLDEITLDSDDVTPGGVAEALVFYKRVVFVGTLHRIIHLVAKVGLEEIAELVGQGHLVIEYQASMYGLLHDRGQLFQYRFSEFNVSADKDGRKIKTPFDDLMIRLREPGASTK